MSTIEFFSNTFYRMSPDDLKSLRYPALISECFNCDFAIRVDGRTFFECSDNDFPLMEFLKQAYAWKENRDFTYQSIETEDNPLISFVREADGLYSIHSPWQKFECLEHFKFEQLKAALDLKYPDYGEPVVIEKSDYRFLVNKEKTKAYYRCEERCSCPACRNYYRQIEKTLPDVCEFLREFGIEPAKPDETMWIDVADPTEYIMVGYTVCGRIMESGQEDHVFISSSGPKADVSVGYDFPNHQPDEYFNIEFWGIKLPYGLDDPLEESADEIQYFRKGSGLGRRIAKLFKKKKEDDL
ncbi:MAG: hypothetical protein K6A14_06225 [Erysipelotrichaceae bacterium]|nr:hypothetical protein [Erysipelotrichaceae bacterium]